MAVRPIDANAMLNELRPVIFEAEHSAVLLSDVSKMMREWVERQPTLTPPNEPLTIEQLREMDGEPAYLKLFDPLLKSGWYIIKAVTEDKIIFRGWQTVYVPIGGMGIDYNLYRRTPEGEEDA